MMYAIARINHVNESDDPTLVVHRARFAAEHAAQPGFRGSLALTLFDGGELVVNLWTDEASALTAREALASAIEDHLVPLLTAPSELLGAGPVTGWGEVVRRSGR